VARNPSLPTLRPSVKSLRESLIAVRRELHANPELSWKEFETQRLILSRLTALGLKDVRPIAGTGVTALLEGSMRGPCVVWRADIDALPVPEKTGLPFASKNPGVMHACGHDAHTAIALAIAQVLAPRRESLAGSVRFIFQPAEEASGGAQSCIDDGVLDHPPVGRVLGLHVSADIPVGAINVAPGPFFASPTSFTITITGRGGHAAAPHQSVDAVVVAAHAIIALQTIISRSVAPSDTAVLTVGTVQAGFRWNVIAESATLTGTIRTYEERVRNQILARIEKIMSGVCDAFGATFTMEHRTSSPPLVNDPDVTQFVIDAALEYFGAERIFGAPSMGAEDMALYLQRRPGCYFWLGARNDRHGSPGRHHDPHFTIEEDALPIGVEFGVRLIEQSLDPGQ